MAQWPIRSTTQASQQSTNWLSLPRIARQPSTFCKARNPYNARDAGQCKHQLRLRSCNIRFWSGPRRTTAVLTGHPPYGDRKILRDLNRKGDGAATAALERDLPRIQPWIANQQQAHNWAERAMQWAKHVAQRWDDHVSSTVPVDQ